MHLRTVQNKYLDTFVHTALSAIHAARTTRPDVALFFIAGNSPLCLIMRWAGIPAVINVDGLDSDRRKWPAFAKKYLRFAESTAPRWADEAITDSHAVADIFERRYGQRIGVVPYGVSDPGYRGTETLERLGLEPRKYILFVGRLEPENNPHLLVEAFSRIDSRQARGMKLVIVGGAPYADEYIRQVWRTADPRVVFPGYVFGQGYWELQRHAYLFCAPTEVGGTHPVILEAMAAGNCVLVNDHPPNAETVGDAGIYFSGQIGVDDLTPSSTRLLEHPELVNDYRARALRRASCTRGSRSPTSTSRCCAASVAPAARACCPSTWSTATRSQSDKRTVSDGGHAGLVSVGIPTYNPLPARARGALGARPGPHGARADRLRRRLARPRGGRRARAARRR